MQTDLRSDTVTKPTTAMLQAMMAAPVGDDVYGEDPTVNKLQQMAAELFGMEAGLFCPSGTMTNQIAIKVHTQPGDELICADNAHVFKYEGGGIAFNSGVQARVVVSDRGKISAPQVAEVINGNDPHFPTTRLVCLENTSNRGGGSIYSFSDMLEIKEVCLKNNLILHLDGARIFNALVEADYTASQLGSLFHSVSVCLSKGLGAPVGSVLLGKKDFISKAKRVRKVFGGGMRQAGYVAAAGIYALENNIQRLKDDHAQTKAVAEVLKQQTWVVSILPVETNIIIFQVSTPELADRFQQHLTQHQVLANKVASDALRFVFHLDISPEQTENLMSLIKHFKA